MLSGIVNRYAASSPLGRLLLIPYRGYYATSYFAPQLRRIPGWLISSRETGNFQYDVSDASKDYAAHVLSLVTGAGWDWSRGVVVVEFEEELQRLQDHVRRSHASNPEQHVTDEVVKPGRRFLYYALARALKPRRVVEAGTASGLGTCLLASALERNRAEGHDGEVLSVDLNPRAGWLVGGGYAERATFRIGEARDVLSALDPASIDLYVHDTTSDPRREAAEFDQLRDKLSPAAIVLGVWHTQALMQLARDTGREYVMFWSEPVGHWYPGSKLGIAFKARSG